MNIADIMHIYPCSAALNLMVMAIKNYVEVQYDI